MMMSPQEDFFWGGAAKGEAATGASYLGAGGGTSMSMSGMALASNRLGVPSVRISSSTRASLTAAARTEERFGSTAAAALRASKENITEFSLDAPPALDEFALLEDAALEDAAPAAAPNNPPPDNPPPAAVPGGRLAVFLVAELALEPPNANENAFDVSSERCALGLGEGTLGCEPSAGAGAWATAGAEGVGSATGDATASGSD